MRTTAVAAALAALTFVAVSASAQDLPQAPVAAQSAQTQALVRAQVAADLDLRHQAGLTYLPSPSAQPEVLDSREYQQAQARYDALRSGPAYQQAVARQLERSALAAK